MKKTVIIRSGIDGTYWNRQMGESFEVEYGEEWDGDVIGYLNNLDSSDCPIRYLEGSENIPGDVHKNFVGENLHHICVVFYDEDTEPSEVWYATTVDE